jgi:hypothetical protein
MTVMKAIDQICEVLAKLPMDASGKNEVNKLIKVMRDELVEFGDRKWLEGRKSAYRQVLQAALGELGGADKDAQSWRLEREAAVSQLRDVCEQHGDNDWPDDLHLGDAIEKHLARYLYELEA